MSFLKTKIKDSSLEFLYNKLHLWEFINGDGAF